MNDKIPCCPDIIKEDNCDVIFFTRTLNYSFPFKDEKGNEYTRFVQLILGLKLTRCSKGLVLGDPVYSTTLIPGEKVRLFSTDRRSKFTYDSESHLYNRSEQMSEESYFMTASQQYFADIENTQSGNETTTENSEWNFSGEADVSLYSLSASTEASRSYESTSVFDYFKRQHSQIHTAARQAVNATNMAHSVSIGEVSSRTHAEGQTEDHFESCSREFSNENHGYAVTYLFYRLNKKQTLKYELVSIDIVLPVIPIKDLNIQFKATKSSNPQVHYSPSNPEIISQSLRAAIMTQVKRDLVSAGIFEFDNPKDATSVRISENLKRKIELSMDFSLPTPGIIVKGWRDECNTLESERERYYKLQNDLLEKQIQLLEKSHEYRCHEDTVDEIDG